MFFTGKEISTDQYTLECNRKLQFSADQLEHCYNYNITDDEVCELGERATQFKVRLSITSTTGLGIDPELSVARVTIDDSKEPECCECVDIHPLIQVSYCLCCSCRSQV